MIPYSKLRKDIDTFFDSPDTLTVYVCLLVRCNYKPEYFESGDFIVDRYKTVMSIDTIAAELKMSRGRVRYSLERLTAAGFISTEKIGKYSVITVNQPDTAPETSGSCRIDL